MAPLDLGLELRAPPAPPPAADVEDVGLLPGEIIVDNFAGGGGASEGIELGLGVPITVAINHDADAVRMHAVNHPATVHLCQSVWKADPREVVKDPLTGLARPVGLAWFSPDCKHFSKAKGSKPVSKNIRDLAWVVEHWARLVAPRIIMLENVEEFRDWGDLMPKLDDRGFPMVGADGLPVLVPDPAKVGQTFKRWWRKICSHGYVGEWRELRASKLGTPTIRKRLYVIFRRDGRPIRWPADTHDAPTAPGVLAGGLRPYRTAAECIDWSIPCPSIFLSREEGRALGVNRPLRENTMARIARGVKRFVIDAERPFIVPLTHAGDQRVYSVDEPGRTQTTANRGEQALVMPYLVPRYGERPATATSPGQAPRCSPVDTVANVITPDANVGSLVTPILIGCGGRAGQSRPRSGAEPSGTTTSKADAALVAAFLAQHNTDMVGHHPVKPMSTIVGKGCTQAVVAAHLSYQYSSNTAGGVGDLGVPGRSVLAEGGHAAMVYSFLAKYYSNAPGQGIDEPAHTPTPRARFGLVIVHVDGIPFVIVDIGMRMLTPRELFRLQGFGEHYVIDRDADGRAITKTAAIRMCGNSVCPPVAEALVRANFAGGAANDNDMSWRRKAVA